MLYFCKVKRKKTIVIPAFCAIIFILLVFCNKPIVVGEWTKQTFLLWMINSFHKQKEDAKPIIDLIDDDSGEGVFDIKKICDELHMRATFAIIPNQMSQIVTDSIKMWQKEGFGIALHGYNHDNWRTWRYKEITTDIDKCKKWLIEKGFDHICIKYVVSPHASNSKDVRKAIQDKDYRMITSANILNPDTSVFQYGRIFITKNTDLKEMEDMLKRARKRKMYVIIGTHSSVKEEFSKEKTKAVLQMAINMGFEYQH